MSQLTRNEHAHVSEQLFRGDKSSLGNKLSRVYSDDFSRNDPKWICKYNSETGLLVFRIYCKLLLKILNEANCSVNINDQDIDLCSCTTNSVWRHPQLDC